MILLSGCTKDLKQNLDNKYEGNNATNLEGDNQGKEESGTDNTDKKKGLSEEEIQELNERVESLLAQVPNISGLSVTISLEKSIFTVGEDTGSGFIYYVCKFPPEIENKKVYAFCGYYKKGNVNTFCCHEAEGGLAGFKWIGSAGDGWRFKEAGSYYCYYGVYDCEDINKTLGVECSTFNLKPKSVFLNVVPLAFDRKEITVIEAT